MGCEALSTLAGGDKLAMVPIIVAINKCDLPEKNISKIKNEMMQYELIAEDLSGSRIIVEIGRAHV